MKPCYATCFPLSHTTSTPRSRCVIDSPQASPCPTRRARRVPACLLRASLKSPKPSVPAPRRGVAAVDQALVRLRCTVCECEGERGVACSERSESADKGFALVRLDCFVAGPSLGSFRVPPQRGELLWSSEQSTPTEDRQVLLCKAAARDGPFYCCRGRVDKEHRYI